MALPEVAFLMSVIAWGWFKAQLIASIWATQKFRLCPTELVYVTAGLRNFSKSVTVGFDNHKGSR